MFTFTENGKKSYLSLQEVLAYYGNLTFTIGEQQLLLQKANSEAVKEYIENNIRILNKLKANLKSELEKDPDYKLIQESDQKLFAANSKNIKYIGENKNKNCFDVFYD